MFDANHYVPILLTKQGERNALKDLPDAVKDRFTPLLVVSPIDWDFDAEAPAKNIDEHLSKLPAQIAACWGSRRAFVDLVMLDDTPMSNGEHPLVWLTSHAGTAGASLVPTVAIGSTPEYKAASAHVIARDECGVCIRLPFTEWPSSSGAALDELLGDLDVDPGAVDLVLDLVDEVGPLATAVARSELTTLPHLAQWRSLTIAGAGMPQPLPAGQGIHVIERREWSLYTTLRNGGTSLPRVPTYGDYSIAHHDPVLDVDPKFMNISASLRYTSEGSWIIPKGGLWKGNGGRSVGGPAMYPVADRLRQEPGYLGSGHCEFETWIETTSQGAPATGGAPGTWRKLGTQHHLTVIAEQIATLAGP